MLVRERGSRHLNVFWVILLSAGLRGVFNLEFKLQYKVLVEVV